MFSSKSKASSSRRLSADVFSGVHGAPASIGPPTAQLQIGTAHVPASAPLPTTVQGVIRGANNATSDHASNNRVAAALLPNPRASTAGNYRPSSKAQALRTFQSLVAGASRPRLDTLQPLSATPGPAPTAAVDDTNPRPVVAPATAAAAAEQHPRAHINAASAQEIHINQQPYQQQHHTHPARPLKAVAPAVSPSQLPPKAAKALNKLKQQLQQRTLTYLYQFDSLLQGAHDAVGALACYLQTNAPEPTAALLQLLPQRELQQEQEVPCPLTKEATDALLQICHTCWDNVMLLLEHHHAAERHNTIQQADQLHNSAKCIWSFCESVQAAAPIASDEENEDDIMEQSQLSVQLVDSLIMLEQVAARWSTVREGAAADWCWQQLRKHLPAVSKSGQDASLVLSMRQRLQSLQFKVLQGSIVMAACHGQQALWANLKSMLQQLLANTVLEVEDAMSMCLSMAGSLADKADGANITSSSSSNPAGQAATAAGVGLLPLSTAASGKRQLLELSAELLDYCRKQALALHKQIPSAATTTAAAGGVVPQEQSPVVQHIITVQQQVLLQLGQAYLASKQYAGTLECVSKLQGLAANCSPVPGLIKLSSLALLGQGKVVPAVAQLCAWLKQGSAAGVNGQAVNDQESAEEACSAVDAFLQALHNNTAATAAERPGAELSGVAAGSEADVKQMVQQIADAAVERCQGQPAVAVSVAMRLLEMEGSSGCRLSSLEHLAVQLLSIEDVAQRLLQRPEDCQRCHAMLHQRGQSHYESQDYATAIALLTPAVFFSSNLSVGKSARLLAMSLIKAGQPQKALDYIGLAEQQEGHSTAVGCLIRLHAQLLNKSSTSSAADAGGGVPQHDGDDDGCIAAVHALGCCSDFNVETMQAAVNLCLQAGHSTAAWEVLKTWSTSSPSSGAPEPANQHPAAASAVAAKQASTDTSSTRMTQALAVMLAIFQQDEHSGCNASLLSHRLADMTQIASSCCSLARKCSSHPASNRTASAAGGVPCYSRQQLMWLADVSMQLGLTAARAAGCSDLCLRAMEAAAGICCIVLLPSASDNALGTNKHKGEVHNQGKAAAEHSAAAGLHYLASSSLCQRHVAAVAAAVSLLLQAHSAEATQQQYLQRARKLLQSAQQSLSALQHLQATADTVVDSEAATAATALEYQMLKLDFVVACREQREADAKRCLQLLAVHSSAAPADLQAAAMECLSPGTTWRSEAVAALAYGFMLRLATAATCMDGSAALDAVTGMMNLVASDAVKVKACNRVAAVLEALQPPQQQQAQGHSAAAAAAAATQSYSAHKMQWLISTCYNLAIQRSPTNSGIAQQYLGCVERLAALQQCSHGRPHWLLGSKQFSTVQAYLAAQQTNKPSHKRSCTEGNDGGSSSSSKRRAVEAATSEETCEAELQSASCTSSTQQPGHNVDSSQSASKLKQQQQHTSHASSPQQAGSSSQLSHGSSSAQGLSELKPADSRGAATAPEQDQNVTTDQQPLKQGISTGLQCDRSTTQPERSACSTHLQAREQQQETEHQHSPAVSNIVETPALHHHTKHSSRADKQATCLPVTLTSTTTAGGEAIEGEDAPAVLAPDLSAGPQTDQQQVAGSPATTRAPSNPALGAIPCTEAGVSSSSSAASPVSVKCAQPGERRTSGSAVAVAADTPASGGADACTALASMDVQQAASPTTSLARLQPDHCQGNGSATTLATATVATPAADDAAACASTLITTDLGACPRNSQHGVLHSVGLTEPVAAESKAPAGAVLSTGKEMGGAVGDPTVQLSRHVLSPGRVNADQAAALLHSTSSQHSPQLLHAGIISLAASQVAAAAEFKQEIEQQLTQQLVMKGIPSNFEDVSVPRSSKAAQHQHVEDQQQQQQKGQLAGQQYCSQGDGPAQQAPSVIHQQQQHEVATANNECVGDHVQQGTCPEHQQQQLLQQQPVVAVSQQQQLLAMALLRCNVVSPANQQPLLQSPPTSQQALQQEEDVMRPAAPADEQQHSGRPSYHASGQHEQEQLCGSNQQHTCNMAQIALAEEQQEQKHSRPQHMGCTSFGSNAAKCLGVSSSLHADQPNKPAVRASNGASEPAAEPCQKQNTQQLSHNVHQATQQRCSNATEQNLATPAFTLGAIQEVPAKHESAQRFIPQATNACVSLSQHGLALQHAEACQVPKTTSVTSPAVSQVNTEVTACCNSVVPCTPLSQQEAGDSSVVGTQQQGLVQQVQTLDKSLKPDQRQQTQQLAQHSAGNGQQLGSMLEQPLLTYVEQQHQQQTHGMKQSLQGIQQQQEKQGMGHQVIFTPQQQHACYQSTSATQSQQQQSQATWQQQNELQLCLSQEGNSQTDIRTSVHPAVHTDQQQPEVQEQCVTELAASQQMQQEHIKHVSCTTSTIGSQQHGQKSIHQQQLQQQQQEAETTADADIDAVAAAVTDDADGCCHAMECDAAATDQPCSSTDVITVTGPRGQSQSPANAEQQAAAATNCQGQLGPVTGMEAVAGVAVDVSADDKDTAAAAAAVDSDGCDTAAKSTAAHPQHQQQVMECLPASDSNVSKPVVRSALTEQHSACPAPLVSTAGDDTDGGAENVGLTTEQVAERRLAQHNESLPAMQQGFVLSTGKPEQHNAMRPNPAAPVPQQMTAPSPNKIGACSNDVVRNVIDPSGKASSRIVLSQAEMDPSQGLGDLLLSDGSDSE